MAREVTPVGPDGLVPQFKKGGKPDATPMQLMFTTHGLASPTASTLTTFAPTPVNHKLWGTIFSNAMENLPIKPSNSTIELVRVDVYPRVKAGEVTAIDMYFQTSNDPGSGTTYGTGLLPVDPPSLPTYVRHRGRKELE